MPSPEELARETIDKLLTDCGWILQKRSTINLEAAHGIAIREGLLKGGDEVDYLLFVDGKAIGTVEAKPEGHTLTGVEEQSGKYGKGLLDIYPKCREPLPFAYESTGVETQFTNQLDPLPKSRSIFVQHLRSAQLDRVCISTIQRLYSMLSLFLSDRNTDAARCDSREETGSASYPFNEACGMVSVVANACGPLLGDAFRWDFPC